MFDYSSFNIRPELLETHFIMNADLQFLQKDGSWGSIKTAKSFSEWYYARVGLLQLTNWKEPDDMVVVHYAYD